MSYLLGHNAHLTQIQAPAVAADPGLGIVADPGAIRWTGLMEAYIDMDVLDQVKGGMRVQTVQTIVDLPVNIPVWPNEEDRMSFVRQGVLYPFSGIQPQTEVLIARRIDGGLVFLGKLRVIVVRS